MKRIFLLCFVLLWLGGCRLPPPAPGWQLQNGKRVYLGGDGQPLQGWQQIEGKTYCLRADGSPITGWLPGSDGTRYFAPDGSLCTGPHTIGGRVHFFAPSGVEVLLVNAAHPLPESYTVEVRSIGGGREIAACCYDDLTAMLADCKAAGCRPAVCSAYRSTEKQTRLFRRKVDHYRRQGHPEAEAIRLAGTVVAAPGTSEHQLGLALDIVDAGHWDLDDSQESTPAQQWLLANSWKYGFILRYPKEKTQQTGVIYEPWHYRWVGRDMAADMQESGLCLEEYLGAVPAA